MRVYASLQHVLEKEMGKYEAWIEKGMPGRSEREIQIINRNFRMNIDALALVIEHLSAKVNIRNGRKEVK